METFLLIAALALVSLWTGRLAQSKGRNPWIWGVASFILGIPLVHLFAVAPLVVLMFIKNPQQRTGSITPTTSCSRCQATSARNSRFCTSCGWELTRQYSPEISPDVSPDVSIGEAPAESEPDSTQRGAAEVSEPVPQESDAEAASAPEAVPAQEVAQVATPESASEPTAQASEAESQPERRISAPVFRKPVPVDAPTATSMTERGVRLFNQGRVQESIDQFTKAIALDPNYSQAWAKRAEAYALLGRGDEAAEDKRRLDALDASSTSG